MPRFFFHIRHENQLVRDPEGTELADLAAARAEALADARELLADQIKGGRVTDEGQIEIWDELECVLATVPLQDAFKPLSSE
jgi:hypothetical protein